ncbi:phage tail protein [Kerstersia gyiorum]|uniref:phage tail protein n=1 Tax=Kerstersia gyiorum TaxID=206506 RepID=UPI00214F81E5|nr:phage tail protein [Kerstersia gyiorum]MCR4158823.1 phage tail protein [Kerstersia gyiorum]
MAKNRFSFPNGSILEMAVAYSDAMGISAISNGKPPVATAASHGLVDGDVGVLASGWARINGRGVRVANSTAGTFELEGLNTASTSRFPVGKGVGSIVVPTDWEPIDRILEVSTSGGDQNFWTGAYLEDDDETQVPTTRSPQSMELTLGDKPNSERDEALLEADASKESQLLRLTLPNGAIILYSGYVSYNDNPQMSRDNPMSTRMVISMSSRPARYEKFAS